jgi:hypothetical protein
MGTTAARVSHWCCIGCGFAPDGAPPPRCPTCSRSRLYFVKTRARRVVFARVVSRWSLLEID